MQALKFQKRCRVKKEWATMLDGGPHMAWLDLATETLIIYHPFLV